jgi:hypothetical protein
MKKLALTVLLSFGLASSALVTHGQEADIPAEGEATLADCQVWLDQLSTLVDEAEPPLSEDVLSEAGERRDAVAQACDDGEFHQGIVMAAETIEMIEEAAGD